MLQLSDFTRGLSLRRAVEWLVGGLLLGLILQVATFVLSPITLQSMREFQCARLNDISQFNPRQLSALSWASFDAPRAYSVNTAPPIIQGYGLVDSQCVQRQIVEPRFAAHVAMCRELAAAGVNGSPQVKSAMRLKDCLAQQPEQSGHWAYHLQQTTIGKIGLVALFTTPALAVADMIYHSLFAFSAAAVFNWICIAYGLLMALYVARRLGYMDSVLSFVLIPVSTIALGSALAFVIQYVMDFSLRWFGNGLEYVGMISGTAAGAFLVAIARDMAATTGEKVVGAMVESSVKAAINPDPVSRPQPGEAKGDQSKPA